MRLLPVDRVAVDRGLKFQPAIPEQGPLLVEESTTVLVDGDVAVAYEVLPAVPRDLLAACRSIKYQETARTDGLVTRSRTFGALPRVTLRRDFCTRASMATDHPREHAVFAKYARAASQRMRRLSAVRWLRQGQLVAGILPEWRIGTSVFTSGIVNHNNALRYHHDAGNFPDVWSAMYAFQHEAEGGDLVVPELGLRFSFRQPALIMFDGARLLHGVTALRVRPLGYRYSVVCYAMKGLCACLSTAAEVPSSRTVTPQRARAPAAGKKVPT